MSPKSILIPFGKNTCIRQILFEIRELHWIRPGNLLGTNLLWYLRGIYLERAVSMKSFGVIHSANVYLLQVGMCQALCTYLLSSQALPLTSCAIQAKTF